MNPTLDWIAAHALPLWALLLALAVLTGDLAWRHNVRWHRATSSAGREPVALRWQMGLTLLLALGLAFAALALAVTAATPGPLLQLDAGLAESLRAHLSLPTLHAIAMITHLGDSLWVALASLLVAAVLLLRRQPRLAGAWAVTLLGVMPINGGLKLLFRRVRPLHDHGLIVEPGWSFPSGHAVGAMVFYGMLAYVLLRLLPPRFHRLTVAAAVLLVGMIGLSRILLQVHYFSDVMAGYAAGAAWLVLCIGATEHLGKPVREARP